MLQPVDLCYNKIRTMTKKKSHNNLGLLDQSLRIMVAIVIAMLFFTKTITGTLGIILIVLAAIFLITGFIGFCPIYAMLGIHSNKKKKPHGSA
jgi:hypothetical protein